MKNAILITIDSLRADHLSCSGYHRKTTPQLDEIAKRGILFSQAISNGTSTPTSFRAILTSTYYSMYEDSKYLSRHRVTIQEALKKRGYSTAAFHSNPWLSSLAGFDRGFDTFCEILGFKKDMLFDGIKVEGSKSLFYRTLIKSRLIKFKMNKLYKFSKGEPFARANTLNKMALSWLRQGKQPKNFFIWLHYMDVHSPYIPSREYFKLFSPSFFSNVKALNVNLKLKFNRQKPEKISEKDLKLLIDLYDAEIRNVDTEIGSFLNELKKQDILHETLIIITADHGEEFLDHGGIGHSRYPEEHLYDELLRVPLIIYAPELGENIVIEDQVELLSIAPTIIDMLGFGRERDNFMGRSLLPLIRGKGEGANGVVSEASEVKRSYRTSEWKLIFDKYSKKCELYNLHNDPDERENIAQMEEKKVDELKQKMLNHEVIVEKERIRRKIKGLKKFKKV